MDWIDNKILWMNLKFLFECVIACYCQYLIFFCVNTITNLIWTCFSESKMLCFFLTSGYLWKQTMRHLPRSDTIIQQPSQNVSNAIIMLLYKYRDPQLLIWQLNHKTDIFASTTQNNWLYNHLCLYNTQYYIFLMYCVLYKLNSIYN